MFQVKAILLCVQNILQATHTNTSHTWLISNVLYLQTPFSPTSPMPPKNLISGRYCLRPPQQHPHTSAAAPLPFQHSHSRTHSNLQPSPDQTPPERQLNLLHELAVLPGRRVRCSGAQCGSAFQSDGVGAVPIDLEQRLQKWGGVGSNYPMWAGS